MPISTKELKLVDRAGGRGTGPELSGIEQHVVDLLRASEMSVDAIAEETSEPV